MRDADAKIVGAYSTALREYAEVLSKDDTVIDTLNAAADALDAALARLVAAAERTEAETKRADWLYQDCEEKLAEIKAAEAERDAAKREQFRAEEAARVATALWEGANDACGDLRAERDAALAQVELARRVTDAYTAEAEDHNDGEFALWKADDLINAIVALRAALGGPDA